RVALLAAALLGAAGVVGLSWWAGPRPQDPPKMIDLVPKPVALIPPGTVIPDGPPEGWTHLLDKSRSHVHSGATDRLNDTLKHLASFLSSAVVLRVEPDPAKGLPPYRLGEIAFGISAVIDGKDTIISSQTQAKLGARLGFLERLGLSRAEARLPTLVVA